MAISSQELNRIRSVRNALRAMSPAERVYAGIIGEEAYKGVATGGEFTINEARSSLTIVYPNSEVVLHRGGPLSEVQIHYIQHKYVARASKPEITAEAKGRIPQQLVITPYKNKAS